MGMFDTFRGKLKCPLCGDMHTFEEQTKQYSCAMDYLLLGDYIDDKNKTYFITFEAQCIKKNEMFQGNIVVVRGQIAEILNEQELNELKDIRDIKNIEAGRGHKLEYMERCKTGIGRNNEIYFGTITYENEKQNWSEHPKKPGEKMYVLGSEWNIKEAYREELAASGNDKIHAFDSIIYEESCVYLVYGKLGERYARVTENFTELFYNNGIKSDYDYKNPEDFFIQSGCLLIKI